MIGTPKESLLKRIGTLKRKTPLKVPFSYDLKEGSSSDIMSSKTMHVWLTMGS